MPNTPTEPRADLAAPAGAPSLAPDISSPDRTTRYCARLDQHLAALPSDKARAVFLQRELEKWDAAYDAFIAAVDSGKAGDPHGPTAGDYVLTIAEIDGRIAKLKARVAA